MHRIVQIMALYFGGYLFEAAMRSMGQKELSTVMKVCRWAICSFWILSLIIDIGIWLDQKMLWLKERLMFIENIFG